MNDFLGEFLDGDEFDKEFMENLDNNPFLIDYLAEKSIKMYTYVNNKLI